MKHFVEATLKLSYVMEMEPDMELEQIREQAQIYLQDHLKVLADESNGGVHVEQFILGDVEPLP